MNDDAMNGAVNHMVNELETITYYKHHYVRKTGLKRLIKAHIDKAVVAARIDELEVSLENIPMLIGELCEYRATRIAQLTKTLTKKGGK